MTYPDTAICLAARDLARDHSPAFLFNHVCRTYAFATEAGRLQNAPCDPEMLFLGSMLHDLGLVDAFAGDDRFELDGADAAADFLSRQGYPDRKIAVIWDAIALHTTLAVPQRKQAEIALLQMGAGIDMGAMPRDLLSEEFVERVLAEYPRLGFKQAMLEAMGAVVRRKPQTGLINLMSDVARAQEGIDLPGFCDVVKCADFVE